MTTGEFINLMTNSIQERKLKYLDKDGQWYDIAQDEEMPKTIYGYAIYVKCQL